MNLKVGDKLFEVIENPKKAYYVEIDKMKEVSRKIANDVSKIENIDIEDEKIEKDPQEVIKLLFESNMLDPKIAYEIAPAITRYRDLGYEERKNLIEKQAEWGDIQELRNFFFKTIFPKILIDEATSKSTEKK